MSDRQYRDKETLRRLYYDEGLTQQEISERYGVCQKTVSNWMGEFDIAPERVRPARSPKHLEAIEERLSEVCE